MATEPPPPSQGPSEPPRVPMPLDRPALSLPFRPASVSRRRWFFGISALVVVSVLLLAHEVLLPFVLALVIAYVFLPGVLWLEGKGLPRWTAIVGIYGVTLGIVYGFGALTAPRIAAEGRALFREVPRMSRQIEEEVLPVWEQKLRSITAPGSPPAMPSTSASIGPPEEPKPALTMNPNADGSIDVDVGSGFEIRPTDGGGYRIEPVEFKKQKGVARAMQYVQRNYMELVRSGVVLVSHVARGIFLFFMTLMLAAYMMLTHEQIIDFFRGLVRAPARPDFDALLTRMNRGLSGVVRGQLMICVVNGVLTAIGFALIGLKYWPVLALVAAVGSLIPIFGSILTSVPAVAIGLTQSPATAFFVLGWILAIHQIEANFLNPKIIGDQAHLHPVLVVFSLLLGEHLFHFAGALLAVPTLSIMQSLWLHFRDVAERELPG